MPSSTLFPSYHGYQEREDYNLRAQTYHIVWRIPEISFFSFTSYEVILPSLFWAFKLPQLPQYKMIDTTWNVLDGVSSCVIGLTQLTNQTTHRPYMSTSKGLMNMCSGIQLLILTALASPYVPYAFAAASVNDFILSWDLLLHTFWRQHAFSYWFADSLEIIKKLEKDLQSLERDNHEMVEKIEEIERYRDHLLEMMVIRLRHRGHTVDASCRKLIDQDNRFSSLLAEDPTAQVLEDQYMREALQPEFQYHLHETFIFSLASTGWILYCIPGMQAHAAVCVSIVALLYLYKHINLMTECCITSNELLDEPVVVTPSISSHQ